MNCPLCWKLGAYWSIAQGLLAAVLPRSSEYFTKKLLGISFENADELAATPRYRRQVRAMGVGMVACGLTWLVLDRGSDAEPETGEE